MPTLHTSPFQVLTPAPTPLCVHGLVLVAPRVAVALVASEVCVCVVVQPLVHCVPADFHAGTMYITVFGRITSQFSLVVTTRSGSVTLVDGLPQQVETSLRTVGGGATGIDDVATLFTHSLFASLLLPCRCAVSGMLKQGNALATVESGSRLRWRRSSSRWWEMLAGMAACLLLSL